MTEERPRPGCLRRSCCGCLALPVLALVVLAVVAGIDRLRRGPEDLRHDERSAVAPARSAGVVHLSVSGASLHVVPVGPDAPLRVVGDYDASVYAVDQQLEPAASESGRWTWKVRGRPRTAGLVRLFHGTEGPELVVELPRGLDVTIQARLKAGSATLDLTGLSIADLDVETSTGQYRILFESASPQPLGSVRVDATTGQMRIDGLGHASPRETNVRGRMGEMAIDLSGAWRGTCRVDARQSMGTLRLNVPKTVPLAIERLHVDFGELSGDPLASSPIEPGAPVVTLRADANLGELEVKTEP
jgi:hypothetical protein